MNFFLYALFAAQFASHRLSSALLRHLYLSTHVLCLYYARRLKLLICISETCLERAFGVRAPSGGEPQRRTVSVWTVMAFQTLRWAGDASAHCLNHRGILAHIDYCVKLSHYGRLSGRPDKSSALRIHPPRWPFNRVPDGVSTPGRTRAKRSNGTTSVHENTYKLFSFCFIFISFRRFFSALFPLGFFRFFIQSLVNVSLISNEMKKAANLFYWYCFW